MSMVASPAATEPSTNHPVPVAVEYDNPQHEKFAPTFRRLRLPSDREAWPARLIGWALAWVLAGLYLAALLTYWAPAHPGVDQNGYFVGGRQFAQSLSTGITLGSDFEFVGRMWVRAESGEHFPKYPLGLPILFAICIWLQPLWNLVGWDGHDVAHLISPVSAALATLGVFAFVRRLAGVYAGLLAQVVMAVSYVMFILAINPNSHALGTCLTVWGFFLLVRWLETGALWRGAASAFLLGYAYLVRYTEGLQALPLAMAMLYAAVWWRPSGKRSLITIGCAIVVALLAFAGAKVMGSAVATGDTWLAPLAAGGGMPFKALVAFVVCALIVSLFIHPRSLWRLLVVGFAWLVPVIYQTVFNMVEMRAFTSYAGTNESTGFHLDYFMANWEKMVRVLNDQGLFFIAPIGLLGLLVMFRRLPVVALILTLWFAPSVLLYTAYYWAPDQWGVAYSRFILTELPALVIAGAWLMGGLMGKDSTAEIQHGLLRRAADGVVPRLAVGAVVLVACGVSSFRAVNGLEWGQRLIPRASLEASSHENKNLAQLGRAARDIIPDGAVVFADGERLHHLQWIRNWQMFPADGFNPENAKRLLWRSASDEDDPDPIDPGRLKFLRDVYANKTQADLTRELHKIMSDAFASGRRVFLVLSDGTSKAFLDKYITPRKREESAFDSVTRTRVTDVPPPMTAFELLEPNERPRMPVGRGLKPMAAPVLNRPRLTTWRIVEILEKRPAAPATRPSATQPVIAELAG